MVLTIVFIISLFSYINIIYLAMNGYTDEQLWNSVWFMFFSYYYDGAYIIYWIIRKIYRFFNIDEAAEAKRKASMTQAERMKATGIYRY